MNTLEILVLIIAISQALGVIGILAAVFYAIRTLGVIAKRAQPTLDEARRTVSNVNHIAENVGTRVEGIASTSDHMVHDVSRKVEQTTTLIQDVIHGPLVQLAAAGVGLSKGFSVWSRWSKGKGEERRD